MRRGWMDSFKPEPFTEREAFLWSIEQAAWEDHDQWFHGQKIPVKRGEFATSLRVMAEAFGWTVKKTRGLMERMSKGEKWAHRTAHSGAQAPTIISVLNYNKYQEFTSGEGTAKGTAKGTRRAQQGHSKGTQQNEGKLNLTKDNSLDSSIGKPMDTSECQLLATDDVGAAFAAYGQLRAEIVSGARPIALTTTRRTKLAARLGEIGGLAGWHRLLGQIRASPFLRGEKTRDGRFLAEIDWLLEPRNMTKIIEGNYDDRPAPRSDGTRPRSGNRSPSSAIFAARDRLFGDRSPG